MKWVLAALLLILVACAPAMPPKEPVPAPKPVEPQVVTEEKVVSPPKDLPPAPVGIDEAITGTPVEPSGWEHDPYTQLGCEQLLAEEEFASSCGKSADALVVTYRIGTRNCFVNVKDRANERLTAGITLTGYSDEETAEEEFDRRLVVLKVGADKSVGERAYEFPKLDRETIHFLRDEFILEVGSDTRLCDEEGLYSVARIVDGRLK
jgi:hypothetical protein